MSRISLGNNIKGKGLRNNAEKKILEKVSLTFEKIMLQPDFNPQAPVAQEIADEVVFRRFQGERVEFF